MEKHCVIIGIAFCLSGALFLEGCLAEELIIGNISVVLQNLEVNLFVLEGDTTTRYVEFMLPNSPVLRTPCRTCDPSYNLFHIKHQYFIPNHSKIYVLNHSSIAPPTEVDIRTCDPVQLHSIKTDVIWVQCAFEDGLIEVVELRQVNNGRWHFHNIQSIRVHSANVSRNGLVLVKEKDGENVTFLYHGDGGRLSRKGLEEYSLARYTKPSLLCEIIEELFVINDELILIQCLLRDAENMRGLVLFNTSNPSQSLTLFHRFHTPLMRVYVFEDYIVLLSIDTIIIRNAVRFTGIEQLIPLPPELSIDGVFAKLRDTIYFVCTNRKEVYFIDVSRVLAGNITAYHKIESEQEICTEVTCSPMQYIGPLLFVPLQTNQLAMYTLDPFKLHTTVDILTGPYRYFFTYTILKRDLTTPSIPNTNDTVRFDESSSEQSRSDGPSSGLIIGMATVAAVVIIFAVFIVTTLLYRYYKKRSLRYYQYHTAEVRFENNQEEGFVIVPGRFNNPVWQFNDGSGNEATEEESNIPAPVLNNQSATNAKKKKNTNLDVACKAAAPNNVDYSDDDGAGFYGFETRQEPVGRREYVDSLVIGTI